VSNNKDIEVFNGTTIKKFSGTEILTPENLPTGHYTFQVQPTDITPPPFTPALEETVF
jgi:hypothetical protein